MSANLTGIFLTGLLLTIIGSLLLLKKRMGASEGWIKVYIGIGLVLSGRLFNLIEGLSGQQLPAFLGGANRVVLEGAICYIGGAIFLLAGFADIAPRVMRVLRGSNEEIRKRFLYSAVNSLIYPGCDLRQAIKSLMGYICTNYKIMTTSIHLVPPAGGTLRYYNGISFKHDLKWLKREFPIKDSVVGSALMQRKIFRFKPGHSVSKTDVNYLQKHQAKYIGIPIITGIKSWGVISIIADSNYKEAKSFESFIKYFAERIGICLDYEKANRENETKGKYLNLHLSIIEILNKWPEISMSLPKIGKKLHEYVKYDHMYLARLDESGQNMWRFVYSNSGQSLIDKGVNVPLRSDILGRLIRNQKPEIFEHAHVDNAIEIEDSANKASKCIGVPLLKDRSLTGALLLSSSEANYTSADLNVLRFLSPVLAEYINHINLKEKFYKREKHLASLAKGFGKVTDRKKLRKLLRDAAKALTTELPVTSCRMMLLDNKGESFRTVGLYQARELEWEESSLNLLPVEVAQTHYNTTIEGRPVIIDFSQANPPMKIREIKQLFYAGVTQAILIPISNGEKNIGIISLGDLRNKTRKKIESDDLNFAIATASRIGLVLEAYSLHQKLQNTDGVESQTDRSPSKNPKSWSLYYNKVMNALSGIIGSAEVVSTTMRDTLDPGISKYLNVIQNNGERIQRLTADFDLETTKERRSTEQNERIKQLENILMS
ncbi:MAG: hypothetical protein GY855_14880 [candidate division Zixibacteria bacterium]|nr:hypothetical protein [candidate division Zixibacteria bacterium]